MRKRAVHYCARCVCGFRCLVCGSPACAAVRSPHAARTGPLPVVSIDVPPGGSIWASQNPRRRQVRIEHCAARDGSWGIAMARYNGCLPSLPTMSVGHDSDLPFSRLGPQVYLLLYYTHTSQVSFAPHSLAFV